MPGLREIWLKKSADKVKSSGGGVTYPWNQVRQLGIIVRLENEKVYRKLLEMQDRLENENPNLRIDFLFWVKGKEAPDYLVATHHHFITSKQVSWSGLPKTDVLSKWMNMKFQVLINMHPDIAELRVLFKKSQASLRVAPETANASKDADMLLKMSNDQSTRETVETMIYYLKMLKK